MSKQKEELPPDIGRRREREPEPSRIHQSNLPFVSAVVDDANAVARWTLLRRSPIALPKDRSLAALFQFAQDKLHLDNDETKNMVVSSVEEDDQHVCTITLPGANAIRGTGPDQVTAENDASDQLFRVMLTHAAYWRHFAIKIRPVEKKDSLAAFLKLPNPQEQKDSGRREVLDAQGNPVQEPVLLAASMDSVKFHLEDGTVQYRITPFVYGVCVAKTIYAYDELEACTQLAHIMLRRMEQTYAVLTHASVLALHAQ